MSEFVKLMSIPSKGFDNIPIYVRKDCIASVLPGKDGNTEVHYTHGNSYTLVVGEPEEILKLMGEKVQPTKSRKKVK